MRLFAVPMVFLQNLLHFIKALFITTYRETKKYVLTLIRVNQQEINAFIIRTKILQTAPITTDPRSHVELVITTSHQDLPMMVASVKSLFYFLGDTYRVLIIDDGTLTPRDLKLIQKHLLGSKIIKKQLLMASARRAFGINSNIYQNLNSPYVTKKVGGYLFAKREKLLFMDSDVFFFRKPSEIITWSNVDSKYFYLQDFENSYMLSNVEVEYFFGCTPIQKLNSGLIGIDKKLLDMSVLEKILAIKNNLSLQRPLQLQVFFAIILARQPEKMIVPLPKSYGIPVNSISSQNQLDATETAVAIHYVRPIRQSYYRDIEKILNNFERRKS
jgi:hypothetical protein